jgi:lipocalin-like protein
MKSVALRDELIGTWKLVSYVETPVDGSPQRFPLGEKPEGILLYAPDGYMSAAIDASREAQVFFRRHV